MSEHFVVDLDFSSHGTVTGPTWCNTWMWWS